MSERAVAEPTRTTWQTRRERATWRVTPTMLVWLSSSVLLTFLLVPLAAIFIRAVPSGAFSTALNDPVVRDALVLSLTTTGLSVVLALLIGVPVAWLLARHRFPGRDILDTLIDLPMVLPPAVAGVALLMAFGRRGIFGPWLSETFGIEIPFTMAAVVMAQTFVAMPFFIKSASAGFASIDRDIEEAARLDGSRMQVAWSVTLPLAFPALLAGTVMTWARALGEFGATIMFAGNFRGRTQTMPLAIYQSMEGGRLNASLALCGILIVVSFVVLILFKWLARRAAGVDHITG